MSEPAAPPEQRPVTALRGVGDALAERLRVLGVEQVQDLLFVLPNRYEDRTVVQPIGSLVAGNRAVVEGEARQACEPPREHRHPLAVVEPEAPVRVREEQRRREEQRQIFDAASRSAAGVTARGGVSTVKRAEGKVGRNEPCPCGSRKKYKQCHGQLN